MKIYLSDDVKNHVVETIEGDAEKAMKLAEFFCIKGERVTKSKFKTESGREGVRLITPTDYSIFYFSEGSER